MTRGRPSRHPRKALRRRATTGTPGLRPVEGRDEPPAGAAPSRDPAITIIGVGLAGDRQLTREACEAIASARRVCFSRYHRAIPELVRQLNPHATLVDLDSDTYELGQYRPDMYRRMAGRIAEEALAAPGVVLLEPGSAIVMDMVTQLVTAEVTRRQLSVKVIPGISCVECVLAELGYDASLGLQVVQAQRLLVHRQRLNPSLATVMIQPGYYDTLFWLGFPESRAARLQPLARHLRRFYPAATPMALLRLRPVEPFDTTTLWFRLADLTALHGYLSPLHTLFIPPVVDEAVDARFLTRIGSWRAALRVVRQDARGRPRQKEPRYWLEEDERGLGPVLIEQSHALAAEWETSRRRRPGYAGDTP